MTGDYVNCLKRQLALRDTFGEICGSYLITAHIVYKRLDYRHLVQDFIWQEHDFLPEIPRLMKFLNHWKSNIEAPIKSIRFYVHDFFVPMSLSHRGIELNLD